MLFDNKVSHYKEIKKEDDKKFELLLINESNVRFSQFFNSPYEREERKKKLKYSKRLIIVGVLNTFLNALFGQMPFKFKKN